MTQNREHTTKVQASTTEDGSEWLGVRAAGWIWSQPIPRPHGDPLAITKYAERRAEAPDGAERLYRESAVRAMVERQRAHAPNAAWFPVETQPVATPGCAPDQPPSFAGVGANRSDERGCATFVASSTIHIVSESELASAFNGTDFGGADHRKLIEVGVLKKAVGYSCGHTLTEIMIGLGLISRKGVLLRRGRDLLRAAFDELMRNGG